MHISVVSLALASIAGVNGLPGMVQKRGASLPDNFNDGTHFYQAQQAGQVRSPCPGLNTLANHGYLPRDGKGISRNALSQAFSMGWGIAQSVINTPTENAFKVCEFNRGGRSGSCPTFDLDDLNTADTFEHDHSMSRQDSRRLYAVNADGSYNPVDNHSFNRSVFGDTLQMIRGEPIMDVPAAESVRLQREHLAYIRDPRDTFKENRLTMLTEIGFVFACMRNFNGSRNGVPQQGPNVLSDQSVQMDWWSYWFSRQEFPTEIGWRKPVPDVENDYVLGIRSSVFSAQASSTPSPLPPDATKSPTVVPLFNTQANNKRAVTLPTPTDGGGFIGLTGVLGATPLSGEAENVLYVPSTVLAQATAAVGKGPDALLPYDIVYEASDFSSYKSALTSYQSALDSAIVSIVAEAAPTA